jgi:hypothetical protein
VPGADRTPPNSRVIVPKTFANKYNAVAPTYQRFVHLNESPANEITGRTQLPGQYGPDTATVKILNPSYESNSLSLAGFSQPVLSHWRRAPRKNDIRLEFDYDATAFLSV